MSLLGGHTLQIMLGLALNGQVMYCYCVHNFRNSRFRLPPYPAFVRLKGEEGRGVVLCGQKVPSRDSDYFYTSTLTIPIFRDDSFHAIHINIYMYTYTLVLPF